MEFEVRHVSGIQNCFVSLPFHLIQTLQSTRRLPQVLTLDLRSTTENDTHWTVAWSGDTSFSPSIEVAPQFAECISLPNHLVVKVKVVTNVVNASLVSIEPNSEDDWEVLELNSELAEASILKQLRIVHEGMRFPLWLRSRSIITFIVVSTLPKQAVVQLVAGTEVAVAPKRRKKEERKGDGFMDSSIRVAKALLRLQDSESRLVHKSNVRGVELGVVLTSVAYVHPETAKRFSLSSLQLVTVVPRLTLKDSVAKAPESDVSDKRESRQAIVHILFSDSVAEGHVVIASSLRSYLRAGLHSWVYLKACSTDLKDNFASLTLCPCHFKTLRQEKATEKNGIELPDSRGIRKPKSPGIKMDIVDLSVHDKIVDALSSNIPSKADKQASYISDCKKGVKVLLRTWFLAQLDAIASATGQEINSLILGKETLLHFQVTGNDFGSDTKAKGKALSNSNASLVTRNKTAEVSFGLLYMLTISDSEEWLRDRKVNAYKFALDKSKENDMEDEEDFGKLKFGDPIMLYSLTERTSIKGYSSNVSSLSWMGTTASDVINRMIVLLSRASGIWFSTYNLPLPGHVLIYGPRGSGKSILARAVAKSLEEHEGLLAHTVFVGCSGLALEKASSIQQALSAYISDALDHAPSLVVLDDLDSIVPSSSDSDGSQSSTHVVALSKFLTNIMDEYEEKRKSSCGIGPIALIACVQSLESIPESLSSSGRFDFHVQLPAPAASERGAILKHEIQRRSLHCSNDILLDVASKCDGYDAYDLEILVDRTVHAAVGRFLPPHSSVEKQETPTLIRDDFSQAMHEFLPVAMRDVTRSPLEGGHSGWNDVGGLDDIRNAIKEMIELPSKFPNIFSQAPLRLRSNVLLYGPPGCGKTHIVGAAAAACSMRFISVKGPELLNKYIGASEQAVRDIFSKAAAAAPCLLFFDEFDSIAPKRGHDNTGVTDRVVNQFLTELDGVEVLSGVFVFAATSRPDLLDTALLRPGRLDRLLFCDFPSPQDRSDILAVLSRKLSLANDVDLDAIAYMTEGFSGADLQAVLSDAQLAAVHEHLSSADGNSPGKLPVITDALLKSIASKARPSISESEKQRLYDIYSQFLNSKKYVAAQSRDAKGKRATLA